MQLFKRGDVIRTRKREGFVLSNQKPGVPFVNVEDTEDGAVYPVHTDNIIAHKYNDDSSNAGNCRVCNFHHGEWSARV